jgi:hypothetical protein
MKLDRREILKLAAGAAFARPLAAGAEALAPAAEGAAAAAPRFFTVAELQALDELTEILIPTDEHSPGAKAAGVAAYIDFTLADKDPKIPEYAEERKAWKEGLAAFVGATPAQRLELLTKASAAEHEPKTEAEKFFVSLKGATAHAYYTSKIGIHQDQDYKGNVLLTEFVGAEDQH